VGKAFEVLVATFNKTKEDRDFIQQQVVPALQQQKNDPDADVRFFATRALHKAEL
jgi:serine/threonine-protein phosphatase 2A regulatory subunit A